MSELGQSRHFDRGPAPSGLPRSTDIVRPPRHDGLVPNSDVENDYRTFRRAPHMRWTRRDESP
jgi:hypothetical protein